MSKLLALEDQPAPKPDAAVHQDECAGEHAHAVHAVEQLLLVDVVFPERRADAVVKVPANVVVCCEADERVRDGLVTGDDIARRNHSCRLRRNVACDISAEGFNVAGILRVRVPRHSGVDTTGVDRQARARGQRDISGDA